MVKVVKLKVSVLERWKRWLSYAKGCADANKDSKTADAIRKVWVDIEAERLKNVSS